MSSSRTKLISARLTDAEYAAVERAAGADTISAWARAALVRAATPPPALAPVPWNARGTPVEQDSNTRVLQRQDEDRREAEPRPHDHMVASSDRPATERISPIDPWGRSTARWRRNPGLPTNASLTRSAAWLPTTVILACLSAVGIAASQYAHASADQALLDLVQPVLWGAVAVLMAGLVPMVADDIALALIRRTARPIGRPARGRCE